MLKKIVFGILGLLLAVVAAGAVFVFVFLPKARATTSLKVEGSAEVVERGRYLANAFGCVHCHTTRDYSFYSSVPKGKALAGGDCLNSDMIPDFPGSVCAANLTPDPETGLGKWSDDEILRALREGISRDGHALFPMMPYREYKNLADKDAHAIVAYLRTVEPVKNAVPKTSIDFPLSVIMRLMPTHVEGPVAPPAEGDTVARGEYLARMMGCKGCHSPVDDHHEPIPGKEYSGGQAIKSKVFNVVSANITPHATGLGDKTEALFISLFRAHKEPAPVGDGANTIMPWADYANAVSDEDLSAIYGYLRTLKPIENSVNKFPDAK